MDQRIRKLDWAERWWVDIWAHMNRADFALSCDINMTPASIFLEDLRKTTTTKLTYTHLFIWSLGKVISNHQELNVIFRGYRHIYPSGVNINFPVASHAIFTPLMFVKDVEKKSLIDLAQEITSRIPIVKQQRDKLIEIFRKFGWLVPSRLLRSLIIKREFHKQPCGFSMTSLPKNVSALTYYTIPPFSSANFAIGRIVETAKADIKQNQLTVQVTLAVDHRIFDGNRAAILLNGLKDFLENIENHNQSENLL